MATKAQSIEFLLSQVRASGVALAGGEVEFFAAGTSTRKTIWLDRNKATPAANPYQLDANGTAQLYGDGIYRIVIRSSAGEEKYDRDYIGIKDASSLAYDVADYASLAAAVASIGGTPATLQFATDQTLTGNLVIPDTLTLLPFNGAKIVLGTYHLDVGGATAEMLGGLQSAIDMFTASGTTSVITVSTPQTISLSKTIPSNLVIRVIGWGNITVATGKTLNCNGRLVMTDPRQYFFGDGRITGLNEAWPEWFGAKGDGVTRCDIAINNAIYAVYNHPPAPSLLGGVVRFTVGRYLVKNYIDYFPGVTLQGVHSGLISQDNTGPTTGSVIVTSPVNPDDTPWNETTIGGVTYSSAISLWASNGGPIQLKSMGFIGTSTVTTSTWFHSAGSGVTQGLISGCRIIGFSTGIATSAFSDVTIENTAFEANTTDIYALASAGVGGFTGNYLSNVVFFSHGAGLVVGQTGNLSNNQFSNCLFQSVDAGAGKLAMTNGGLAGGRMENNQFSNCRFDYNAGSAAYIYGGDCYFSAIFSNCRFTAAGFYVPYVAGAVTAVERLKFTGCLFEGSSVTLEYEIARATFVGNDFKGASALVFSVPTKIIIAANNFSEASNAGADITLGVDAGADFSITGNIFRNGAGGISSIPTGSARYSIWGNTNSTVNVLMIPATTYADNAAATAGGLKVGTVYRVTGAGTMAIVY